MNQLECICRCQTFPSSLTITLHCYRNHVRIMKRLVQAGVDNEAKGEFQNTPLHVACGSGSVDAVSLYKHVICCETCGPYTLSYHR